MKILNSLHTSQHQVIQDGESYAVTVDTYQADGEMRYKYKAWGANGEQVAYGRNCDDYNEALARVEEDIKDLKAVK